MHPAVAAALHAAHVQHPAAAHDLHHESVKAPLAAAKQQHKLKVEAELENAEHMHAMAAAAAKKVFNAAVLLRRIWSSFASATDVFVQAFDLALSIHTQAGKCLLHRPFA